MHCRAIRCCGFAVLLCFLAGLQFCSALSPCAVNGSRTLRDQMLARFRSHFADKDKGYFDRPHRREFGDQLIMISKKDSFCGGSAEPTYYIEFLVKDARPVDVFNVLVNPLQQPEWLCKGCTVSLVANNVEEQVQGFAAAYRALPVNRREFYHWQAVDANFTAEEFLLGTDARHNQELHRLKKPEPDATIARMCYSFSHLRKDPQGTRVIQMSHFNVRVPFSFGPFTPQHLYTMIWPMMLERVPLIIERAQWQAKRNWEAGRVEIADAFLPVAAGNNASNRSSPSFRARHSVAMPRVGTSTDKDDSIDDDSAKRLPWITAALVLLVGFVLSSLFGLYRFCTANKGGDEEDSSEWSEWEDDEEAEHKEAE